MVIRHKEMNEKPLPLFRSTGKPGFLHVASSASGWVRARKLAREVSVRFASESCEVPTAEGIAHARPGDAILTGLSGEHWRVSRAHFPGKYEPVAPTVAGEDGRYLSRRYEVLARAMSEGFQVLLSDGESCLTGRPDDWLVDYGDGSLGIVSPRIFSITYEIVG
jgi:hypothetical protein